MPSGGHTRRRAARGSLVRARLAAAILLGALLLPSAGAARVPEPDRQAPVEITADEILYDGRAKVYVAEGSVRIEQPGRSLEADWIVFNRETQRGIAAGNVVAIDGDERVDAGFVEFDYATGQGLVFRGRLDLGPGSFVIGAEEFLKTGDTTYEGEDVSFTTCRCPDPDDRLPWQLNAEDGDLEVGGYATTSNTSVDILGIPTIWLPWAIFPVKTERETGFLFPEFGYQSSNGFQVGVPFFLAARHDVNVTATPRYLTRRGLKPELDVETVYGEASETNGYGTYLHDAKPRKSLREGDPAATNIYTSNRWGAKFDDDTYLPYDVRARADFTLVSDNYVPRDFDEFGGFRRDRYIESDAFAFRHFTSDGRAAVVGSVAYADDRQNPDYLDRDHFVLQRAPAVTADWLPSPVADAGGFTFAFDTDYTSYQSFEVAQNALNLGPNDFIVGKDQFIDTGVGALTFVDQSFELSQVRVKEKIAGIKIKRPLTPAETNQILARIGYDNGRFDEGEPLDDEGQRVIFHPRVGRPFRVGAVDVLPEVGWQQTLYSTEAQSFADRGLLTARLDASTQLAGVVDAPFLGPTTHVLEPRLGWALVQHRSQRNNPLFVPQTALPQTRLRQMSLGNVVLDTADRIPSANVLTLGAGNRFYAGAGAQRRLVADVALSAGYDFAGESAGHPEELILDAQLFLPYGIRTRSIVAYDMHDEVIEEGLFDVLLGAVRLPFVDHLALDASYRYRRDIPLFYEVFPNINTFQNFERGYTRINQVSVRPRLTINERWAVGATTTYSFENGILQQNAGFVEYTSRCKCWALRVDVSDNRASGFGANARIALWNVGDGSASPFTGTGFGTADLQ